MIALVGRVSITWPSCEFRLGADTHVEAWLRVLKREGSRRIIGKLLFAAVIEPRTNV